MVKGENRLNRVSDITNRTENFNITAGGSLASWQFTKGKVVKFGSIGPQNASDWSLAFANRILHAGCKGR